MGGLVGAMEGGRIVGRIGLLRGRACELFP